MVHQPWTHCNSFGGSLPGDFDGPQVMEMSSSGPFMHSFSVWARVNHWNLRGGSRLWKLIWTLTITGRSCTELAEKSNPPLPTTATDIHGTALARTSPYKGRLGQCGYPRHPCQFLAKVHFDSVAFGGATAKRMTCTGVAWRFLHWCRRKLGMWTMEVRLEFANCEKKTLVMNSKSCPGRMESYKQVDSLRRFFFCCPLLCIT